MKKIEIKNYIIKHEIKKQLWFGSDFCLGNYAVQDKSLQNQYAIEDGKVFVIVLRDHSFAYITIYNNDDSIYNDGYLVFKDYKTLINLIKQQHKRTP